MTKILIIAKDSQFARALNYTLTFSGFIVESASKIDIAAKFLNEINFNLVLVDFPFVSDLPSLSTDASVIVMGECYEEMSILDNMYNGMDDYILKPFGMSELKMIINKQLERKRLMTRPIVFGDLRIDVARSLVTVKDSIISLGKKEMEIMIILARKAGKIVSSDRLITEQRIASLKRKLQHTAGEALQIRTIRGIGYKLISPESSG